MRYYHNDREIEIDEIDGELNEGAWVVSAYYIDGDEDLIDDEGLEVISDKYQESLYERYYENCVGAAEDYFDMER